MVKKSSQKTNQKFWPLAVLGGLLFFPTAQVIFWVVQTSNAILAAILATVMQVTGITMLIFATVKKIEALNKHNEKLHKAWPYFLSIGAIGVLLILVFVSI